MGKDRVNSKEALSIPTMIFCIIGAVLVVLGFLLIKNNNFRLNVISTEGTVTGVQTATNANGEVESRSATLSYTASKGDYTANINNVVDDVQIGDKINLYYDFFEPSSVSDSRRGYQGYLALIIGLIALLKTGPRFYRIIRDNYL